MSRINLDFTFLVTSLSDDVIEEKDLHFECLVGKAEGKPTGRGHFVFFTYMVLVLAFSSLRPSTLSADA